MWVYKRTEPTVYTVGFFDPKGNWHSDRDYGTPNDAAERVSYLNGCNATKEMLDYALKALDYALNTDDGT